MGLVWCNPTDEMLCLQWLPAIVAPLSGSFRDTSAGEAFKFAKHISRFPHYFINLRLLMHGELSPCFNLEQVNYFIRKKWMGKIFPHLNESINHSINRNKGVQHETAHSTCSQVKDHQHINSFIPAKGDRSWCINLTITFQYTDYRF